MSRYSGSLDIVNFCVAFFKFTIYTVCPLFLFALQGTHVISQASLKIMKGRWAINKL